MLRAMPFTLARRVAGAALTGAVVVLAALPAAAAPRAEVGLYQPDVLAPAGADGGAYATPLLLLPEEATFSEARVTWKLSGDVPGLSFVADPEECEVDSPIEVSCSRSTMPVFAGAVSPQFAVYVKADASAEIGAEAGLTTTFSADGVDPITASGTVTVAQAVDLTAGEGRQISAKPGATVDVPLEVRNSGAEPVAGAAVVFHHTYSAAPGKRYRNCLYAEHEQTTCVFDQTLAPGASYIANVPWKLGADAHAPGYQGSGIQWMTAAEYAGLVALNDRFGIDMGTPGGGEELTLQDLTVQRRAAAPQTDAHPDDNWSTLDITMTGKNGIDLVAVGGNLKGDEGDEVTAEIGVDNKGPATAVVPSVNTSATFTRLTVPAGVTVTAVTDRCQGIDSDGNWQADGEPGHPEYSCRAGLVMRAGQKERFEFTFRIDDASSAAGKVVVNEPCDGCDFVDDLDQSNNTAVLSVNRGAGGGTGGGDEEPGLPITGPNGATTALVGVALVLLGTAALVLTRRRPRPAVTD